ncbi:hypothetical protein [Bythopirellula polymerisocia]|uniref:Uncharacterized protein n=1 Tax=Bythopirellula polymerisocia TaxID=2528003 RepID=A0A5C6CVP9_9BACT|nr:hypothetical protein [Bythopirellula polymerisocia]TWU27521.1 hypothetical protein Pla144_22950 [Bythopirellula polymerisocia]
MALNPLAPVTDYQSMLNRICWFTSAAALGAFWLLRMHVPVMETLLSQLDIGLKTSEGKMLPVPGGSLLPALAVGMVARVFRIHSHLGHWLGIRERFDIEVILTELGRRVGIDVDTVTEKHWLSQRHDLMRQAFYQFASSQSPKIDEHLIHQALDLWSWFWIGLEATAVFVLTGFVLIALQVYEVGLATFGGALLLAAVGLPMIRVQCKSYAIAQVRAILADPSREAIVRNAFNSLAGNRYPQERAA